MALQSLKGGAWWPSPTFPLQVNGAHTSAAPISSMTLDVSGEKTAFIFQAPFTGSISEIDYYVSTVTTSGDLDVRIETVSATDGNPTGTLVSTNSNLSATISTTGNKVAALTASASVTRGTYYAVVFARTTGNYAIAILDNTARTHGATTVLSYHRYHNGTSWSTQGASISQLQRPCLAIKWSDGEYRFIEGAYPFRSLTNVDFNNASADRERGIRFIPRVSMRASGWFAHVSIVGVSIDVVLADQGGTAVGTYTGDADYGSAYAGSNYNKWSQGFFAETPTLTVGDTYYLTAKPKSATNIRVTDALLIDTGDETMMNMVSGGVDVVLATRNSGGAYSTDTTKRPVNFGLIIDQLDDGVGGGGGSAVYYSRPSSLLRR